MAKTGLKPFCQYCSMSIDNDKAEKQKEKAKEMLGIGDKRAKELFDEDSGKSHKPDGQ